MLFALAGLDIGAIGGKTIINFSSGWALIIKRQILSSIIKQKSALVCALTTIQPVKNIASFGFSHTESIWKFVS